MPYESDPIDESDVVCGMDVDPEQAHELGLEAEYVGRRYVFCSVTCRDTFKNAPDRYTAREQPTA